MPEPGVAPPIAFVLCVERGVLEAQALLLCASLRRFGGRLAEAPVHAVSPRPGRRPLRATVDALQALRVDYHELALSAGCDEYGSANRLLASAWLEQETAAELVAGLDSDAVFLAEPARLVLAAGVSAAARPVDVKSMCTAGPEDPADPYWRRVCAIAGVDYEALPWVATGCRDATVRAAYNGGLIVARAAHGVFRRAAAIFVATVRQGLLPWRPPVDRIHSSTGLVQPDAARWWGSNQAALAVAMAGSPGRIELLPPGYNYPLHLHAALPDDVRAAACADLVHAHYHFGFEPAFAAGNPLLVEGSPLPPAQREWLAARLPVVAPEVSGVPTIPGG